MNDILDESCRDLGHAYGCPCRAGGDPVLAPFRCRCGLTRFVTAAEADRRIVSATGSSPLKCPKCRTRATDHPFRGGLDDGEDRCFECDGRYHSHGGAA